jgi:hypothetical protein
LRQIGTVLTIQLLNGNEAMLIGLGGALLRITPRQQLALFTRVKRASAFGR